LKLNIKSMSGSKILKFWIRDAFKILRRNKIHILGGRQKPYCIKLQNWRDALSKLYQIYLHFSHPSLKANTMNSSKQSNTLPLGLIY
jgi:hypothetical protein